jgi:hypothetical protein
MRRGGRERAHFDVHGGGFVATGPDEKSVAQAMEWVRGRIALYASTRTYLPILALHGLEELNQRLHAMTVAGRWSEMPALITDDVVRAFAACGTYATLAGAVAERWGGAADTIEMNFPTGTPIGLQRELLADIRRIPHTFTGFGGG